MNLNSKTWQERYPDERGAVGVMFKHGRSQHGDKAYQTWANMHTRCTNAKAQSFGRYGGKGIKVCEQWGSFETFLADIGDPPSPQHSIDRIDSRGNYEPSNCRWIPLSEQSRNKSDNRWITANGQTKLLEDWAKITGMNKTTIFMRITAYGYTESQAINTPLRIRSRSPSI